MNWLAITLWGGAVGLDATSFPQVMISRPIVAAPVAGLLLGRPLEGVAVGVLLELFALVILPIGAARYPEAGTAAVAATAGYVAASGGAQRADLLLLAVAFGLLWERVCGASVNALRRLNERLVVNVDGHRPVSARRLEGLHLAALALDFGRGALVTVGGGALAAAGLGAAGALQGIGADGAAGMLCVAGAAMAGAALSLFDGWSGRRFAVVLGLICGLILSIIG